MQKYSFINFDGDLVEVEMTKEVRDFLNEDKKRVNREERQARRYCKHFNLYSWNNFALLSVPSVEDDFFALEERGKVEAEQKKMLDKIYRVLDKCTTKQRERFLFFAIEGMTYRDIAHIERITHSKIQKSVEQVLKKIKKSFENPQK